MRERPWLAASIASREMGVRQPGEQEGLRSSLTARGGSVLRSQDRARLGPGLGRTSDRPRSGGLTGPPRRGGEA